MLQLRMFKEAEGLLRELQGLPWSPVYYPKIHTALKELEEQLSTGRQKASG
jgi:hypothetical protein